MALLNESDRLTRPHVAILAFAWSAWFFGFYSLTLLSFVLPPVEKAFGATELELAWLTGTAIGATGAGGLLFGWISDALGRRTSTWIAVAVFAAGNLASALAPGFAPFVAARAMAGLGIGGTWGAGQALIGETFPARWRGRFGAIAQSGAPLGLGLATVMGSFAAPAIGWREVFALSALPAFILVLLKFVPESDVWSSHPRRESIAREFASSGTPGAFVRCFVLTLLNMSNYWFAVIWLPRYLQKERGMSEARSGLSTLAFVTGSLAGYLSFGIVSDRFGRRISFTAYSGLMALGLAMFTSFWPVISGTPQLLVVFMFLAGVGTGTWSSYGPLFSEIFPTRVRGTAMSVIMNATRGVQFLAPVAIAAVASRWGMAGGIVLAAGFAVLAGAWVWTLPETRGRLITAEGAPRT
jgi:MFS family permease